MLLRIASLAVLSSFALVATQEDAQACSPPSCWPAIAAPMPGAAALPASTPALPYVMTSSSGGGSGTTFRVIDPGGAEAPTTSKPDPWWSGGYLLAPNAPLVAGTGYRLTYVESCAFGATAGEVKTAFDVLPTVALPTIAGTLHGTNRVVGKRNVPTSSGSCTSNIDAVAIDVRVTPTPELLAFASVASFKVFVDGQEASDTYYGRGKVDADGIVVTTLVAACGTRASGDSNGPTLGVHKIGVRAHVAGAASDPAELVSYINFSCTDDTVEADGGLTDSDAGVVTPDAGPPSGNGSDSGVVLSDNADSTGSGCSTSGSSGKPAGAFAMLVAGLALVAARIRRKTR